MIRIDAPYIDQSVSHPTGCESVTAVMLLHFLGVDITVDEFVEQYLDCGEFQEKDGVLYGPDPRKCFVGSPYDPDAFGCYAPVICCALRKVLKESYLVKDETGTAVERLITTYIDNGIPVIFWACINCREPIVGPRWVIRETREMFTWISNEHCMLLVGYDDENYYFNDPFENNGFVGYPKGVIKHRHAAQHMQAAVVLKK